MSNEKSLRSPNKRVHFISVYEESSKSNIHSSQLKEYAEVKDNWINYLLYETRLGLLVNITALISITAHYMLTISHKLQDEQVYASIISAVYVPTITQFFTVYVPLDLLMHLVLIVLLYPLSRYSRSTRYYWFIGVTNVLIISCIAYFDVYCTRTNVFTRLILSCECARLSMKVAAFLFECNESERVFNETNVTSLLYYLLIPHLVYKPVYKKARSRRWFRIICHLWWFWVLVFPFGTYLFQHFFPLLVFDIADGVDSYIKFAVYLAMSTFFGYFILVWFFIFANFLSFHAELFKFPDHRFMGSPNFALQGAQIATGINTIASKWFARYCYVPVVEATKSRYLALTFAFAVTSFWHEFVLSYTFNQLCVINIPLVMAAPIFLYYNRDSLVVRTMILVIFITILPFWWVTHPLEFLAWNYSTIPGIEDESKWRLVPLFLTYNIKQHFIPWINANF